MSLAKLALLFLLSILAVAGAAALLAYAVPVYIGTIPAWR